jgi:glycosyltransferase involved in cell wall biosynthesis
VCVFIYISRNYVLNYRVIWYVLYDKEEKMKVSINCPTRNNVKTMKVVLDAVKNQTYKDFEFVLLDSSSTDGTVEKVMEFGNNVPFQVRIINIPGALLEARIIGAKHSLGEYVLFLDSDQVLHPKAIEWLVEGIEKGGHDAMWLYERAYNRYKWVPRLYDADRIIVQENLKEDVVLPRFWKKDLLIKAMDNIPTTIFPFCYSHDHLFIFKEFQKISINIGSVGTYEEPAVEHHEPDSLKNIWKKQYVYGITTRQLKEKGVYPELIKTRHSFRRFHFKRPWLSTKVFFLRVFRGVPYMWGYKFGKKRK